MTAGARKTGTTEIAVATTSALAAEAALDVQDRGGNAVDCALAASLLTMNTEPGVCALAGGAYVTVWGPDTDPVTIDGNVAVPGSGLAEHERRRGAESVSMDYGGGIETLVGAGSVGVPGSLAAVESAWRRFGRADWADLLAPSIAAARDGFPLSSACHYYLGYSGASVFGRSRDGFDALHRSDGSLRAANETIRVPHLADSLGAIAEEGAAAFYQGDVARRIVDHVRAGNGMLTHDDMRSYAALVRPALTVRIGNWRIASNPPPAIGGTVLAAMLEAFAKTRHRSWNTAALADLIDIQHACLDYRREHLDLAEDSGEAAARLLELATGGRLLSRYASASTVHTSAVDDSGLGCAITASSGYGSGEMPEGTGLWLNNCLGELELNRRGLDAGPVGSRLPSNMAPTVCRSTEPGSERAVLAAGSPGADRITTALLQALVGRFIFEWPLEQAIAHPRLHVDTSGANDRLMAEPGLELPETALPQTVFDTPSMYFGGVAAAHYDGDGRFALAADPRREGGAARSADACS
ncbi:MAG: gamma-glutamyltransferase [Pseudomonadota bacterium]